MVVEFSKLINILFSDNIRAYDKVWVIGDAFVARSFAQYFQDAFGMDGKKVGYIRAHYDVTGYCQDSGLNASIWSRLHNGLVEALNKQVLLPKAILLVLEDDIIRNVNFFQQGFSSLLGRLLEWLSNQIHRVITARKEKLPSKSRKFKYPTILWCLLPEHYGFGPKNEFRKKLNCCISSVTALFREMETLPIEWDELDMSLISKETFTAKGFLVFWQKLNLAFEKWDKEQMRILHTSTTPQGNGRLYSCGTTKENKQAGRHRERKEVSQKFHWKPGQTKFKLPKPKPKNS